ncbi:MAG TPA: hypothetical protein PK006_04540 [Saprospiraceae bacterium]|nr:hypothetical protein [Saprospiraceae bacterium]
MKIIHPLILVCLIASYTHTIAQPSTGFLNSFQAFPQKNRWIAGFSSNIKTSVSYGIKDNFLVSLAIPLAIYNIELEFLTKYKIAITKNHQITAVFTIMPLRYLKLKDYNAEYINGLTSYEYKKGRFTLGAGLGYASFSDWVNFIWLDDIVTLFATNSSLYINELYLKNKISNIYLELKSEIKFNKRSSLLLEYYFQKSDQYKREYGLNIHMPTAAIRYEYKRLAIDYGFLFLNYSRMFPKFNLYFALGKNHRLRE